MKLGYRLAAAFLLVGCWSDNPRPSQAADAGLAEVRVTGAFVTRGFPTSPRVCREGDASAVCVTGGIVP